MTMKAKKKKYSFNKHNQNKIDLIRRLCSLLHDIFFQGFVEV